MSQPDLFEMEINLEDFQSILPVSLFQEIEQELITKTRGTLQMVL